MTGVRRRYDVGTSGIEDCETLSQGREERGQITQSAHFIFKITPSPRPLVEVDMGEVRDQAGW